MPVGTADQMRQLAEIDKHHGVLTDTKDSWWTHFTVLVYSERGVPLVGVALRPQTCPADPTADLRILYWLADTRSDRLNIALRRNALEITQVMKTNGWHRVWGMVPKKAEHLIAFLDAVVDAGDCTRLDGSDVDEEYVNFFFYIAEREAAADYMTGRRR